MSTSSTDASTCARILQECAARTGTEIVRKQRLCVARTAFVLWMLLICTCAMCVAYLLLKNESAVRARATIAAGDSLGGHTSLATGQMQ